MKNMKGKIIALIMLIPLLLMFTTSSVISVTQLLVDMPITAITIQGEKNRVIELTDLIVEDRQAQARESLTIRAQVTPIEAATDREGRNKITYRVGEIEGKPLAKVVVKPSGEVIPLSTGAAAIYVEGDGRSDVVNMYFTSEIAIGATSGDIVELDEGETLNLSERYGIEGEWYSQDSAIATVNTYSGVLQTSLMGSTSITVNYDGLQIDSTTGAVTLEKLNFTLQVRVNMSETWGISFGGSNQKEVAVNGKSGQVLFAIKGVSVDDLVARNIALNNYAFTLLENGLVCCDFELSTEVDDAGVTVEIGRKNGDRLGSFTAVPFDNQETTAKFSDNIKTIALRENTNRRQLTDLLLSGVSDDVEVKVRSSNEAVATFTVSGRSQDGNFTVYYSAYSEGETTLSAQVTRKDGTPIDVEPITVRVAVPYKSLIIETQMLDITLKSGSLDNVLVVGKYTLNESGNLQNLQSYGEGQNFDFVLSGVLSNSSVSAHIENVNDKLKWTSSNMNIAYVSDGRLFFGTESGEVLLKVENSQPLDGYNDSAQIRLNIRQNGINISSYNDLMTVSKNGQYESVLAKDIKLAPELEIRASESDFDYNSYVNNCTTVMNTTADNTYYKNCGIEGDSVIRYAVAINNNLYGNGYSIDGDNLTSLLAKRYNTRIFRGPLDIVRYSINMGGDENMAIKAQDNVVFIVLKDDINIINVELKGCSDSSMQEGNSADLTKLDYCGTVLEVVGDKVNISYSRINNGRTNVRIFGVAANTDGEVDDLRIHTNLSNCLLRYGREFLLKIGTNKQKKNTSVVGAAYLKSASYLPTTYPQLYDDASPYLTKVDGSNYIPAQDIDEYFYDNYVLNDVTVRDCVFMDAGLFSVGLESMFGGLVLHGYDYDENFAFSKLGWSGIAGTSYPSVLRLEGNVSFYDWKQVDRVDSSTLIEGSSSELAARIGLNMDMAALIDSYSQTEVGKNIVATYIDGKKYVNGAIAYYGGGKNYSYVDVSAVGESFVELHDYSVPISYFIASGRAHLIYYTAGAQPFRFMLYDSTSSLGVLEQDNAIKDNSAFSALYRK